MSLGSHELMSLSEGNLDSFKYIKNNGNSTKFKHLKRHQELVMFKYSALFVIYFSHLFLHVKFSACSIQQEIDFTCVARTHANIEGGDLYSNS